MSKSEKGTNGEDGRHPKYLRITAGRYVGTAICRQITNNADTGTMVPMPSVLYCTGLYYCTESFL